MEYATLRPILQGQEGKCNAELLGRYAAQYGDLFARADQRECFRLYLLGLLTAPARKNVEGIASAVAAEILSGANLGQALQHFISHSNWDHTRIFSRYRHLLAATRRESVKAFVVHDGAFLKKGRNSVGAQRQMARSLKRKLNCQVAVVVGTIDEWGYLPLATRLYLPGNWLRDNEAVVQKTVPAHLHQHVAKRAIALNLIDELQAEGWKAREAIVEEGYRAAEGMAEELSQRGLELTEDRVNAVAKASESLEELKNRLGLDHFEGRMWMGWHHHAAMVFAAAGFLLSNSGK